MYNYFMAVILNQIKIPIATSCGVQDMNVFTFISVQKDCSLSCIDPERNKKQAVWAVSDPKFWMIDGYNISGKIRGVYF